MSKSRELSANISLSFFNNTKRFVYALGVKAKEVKREK